MRYFFLFLLAVALFSCVSSGKYKKHIAVSEALFAQQADSIRFLQDSTLKMRLAVERADGRNDGLLATQDKYLARLQEQEDQLDNVRGNLSSTNSQMSSQVAELRKQLAANGAFQDSLFARQSELISGFQEGVEDAAALLDTMLRGKVDSLSYIVSTGTGTATLSVREDVLFKSRTADRLTDEASFVLRAVTNTLQDDPLLKLTIVGHTDNQPNPRRGTDNWKYAALRSTTIADELNQVYYLSPNRIISASHGEFGPVASNSSPEGRLQNRRVDFVFVNNVGNLVRDLSKLTREAPDKN